MYAENPKILLFPFDLGGNRSGTREGPDFFRAYAEADPDLSEFAPFVDDTILSDTPRDPLRSARLSSNTPSFSTPHYLDETVEACSLLGCRVHETIRHGNRPLVIGGDHCAPMGSLAAAYGVYGSRLGVVWIDAHLDAHTMSTGSPSGNTNGMPVAALLGEGHPRLLSMIANLASSRASMSAPQWFHVGADSFEEGEERFIRSRVSEGLTLWTYQELQGRPPVDFLESFSDFLNRMEYIWVSFDLDAVRAVWAPAVAYNRDGRLSMSFVLDIAAQIGTSRKVVGADIVEMNPRREERYTAGPWAGKPKTALLAAEFAKRIFSIESRVEPYALPHAT